MTTREKVIKRLNEGFNAGIHQDTPWKTHMKTGWPDALSWSIGRYGCDVSATEALKWDRWVITDDCEIIEYYKGDHDTYLDRDYRIEKN